MQDGPLEPLPKRRMPFRCLFASHVLVRTARQAAWLSLGDASTLFRVCNGTVVQRYALTLQHRNQHSTMFPPKLLQGKQVPNYLNKPWLISRFFSSMYQIGKKSAFAQEVLLNPNTLKPEILLRNSCHTKEGDNKGALQFRVWGSGFRV